MYRCPMTGEPDRTDTANPRSAGTPERREDRPWHVEGMRRETEGEGKDQPKRPWWLTLAWLVGTYLLVFTIFTFLDRSDVVTVPYTEFSSQVDARNVESVFARGDSIDGILREPAPLPGVTVAEGETPPTYTEFQTERPTFAEDNLLARLQAGDTTVSATPIVEDRGILGNLLISLAPWLLIFGAYWFIIRRQTQAMGGLFGGGQRKQPVNPEEVRVTFDDVAGIDEVEAEITEIVDFLKNPDKYRRLGARVPKGVLLTGPPGTGKTLLARATAGEASVPFFSASASEFIEMIVGVGAQRVRELFGEARKVAPAIVFIDEIDTIGRARGGAHSVGGHDEREQTLNQILTEMDGFSGHEGVVVLAATNRPDVLDPALLRPGRFDRQIVVHAPDQVGRREILEIHTRDIPLADDVDLDEVARSTPGMTGADLRNLANEAALLAARRAQDTVKARDIRDALEKIQLGTAREVVMPAEERRRTAYHEAGHALLGIIQPGADPVRVVSIIPRGRALGATLSTPESDRYGYDERYLRGRVIGALGGMAAEEAVFGVTSTGAENDLEQATRIVRQMVGRWGMSDRIGPISVLPSDGDPRMAGVSDGMLTSVDEETRRVIEECYDEARRLLGEHRDQLDAIATQLLEHETLNSQQVYAAAGAPPPDRPEASADVRTAARARMADPQRPD